MSMAFSVFVLGLLIFIALHSSRLFVDAWRQRFIAQRGEKSWKAIYSIVSLTAFVALIWGYANSHHESVVLWSPIPAARAVVPVLMLLSFILLVAAHIPRTHIKAKLGHPMLAGTAVWALAHLLVKSTLTAVLLFGVFLLWALATFINSRRRDAKDGRRYDAQSWLPDGLAIVLGIVLTYAFAKWGHAWLIGVPVS